MTKLRQRRISTRTSCNFDIPIVVPASKRCKKYGRSALLLHPPHSHTTARVRDSERRQSVRRSSCILAGGQCTSQAQAGNLALTIGGIRYARNQRFFAPAQVPSPARRLRASDGDKLVGRGAKRRWGGHFGEDIRRRRCVCAAGNGRYD